jgi:hypothetical protein
MLKGDNPLNKIKQEIRFGESSSVYISADNETEEEVGSSEYNLAVKHSSASSSQIQ